MSEYGDDSHGMRLVVAAFRRRYRREPRDSERERLRAALGRAVSIKRTPVKYVSTMLERGQEGSDRLIALEKALSRAEVSADEPPNVPRDALAASEFSPDAYLVSPEGGWNHPSGE